jgi:hypothetical protein
MTSTPHPSETTPLWQGIVVASFIAFGCGFLAGIALFEREAEKLRREAEETERHLRETAAALQELRATAAAHGIVEL